MAVKVRIDTGGGLFPQPASAAVAGHRAPTKAFGVTHGGRTQGSWAEYKP